MYLYRAMKLSSTRLNIGCRFDDDINTVRRAEFRFHIATCPAFPTASLAGHGWLTVVTESVTIPGDQELRGFRHRAAVPS